MTELLSDAVLQRVLHVGYGNPGAITVLATILRDHPDKFDGVLEKLELREIRGSDIWLIYKKDCEQSIERFLMFFKDGEQD